MNIKVKSTAAKEASVSIGMSQTSAEVLRLFMLAAVDKLDMSDVVSGIFTDLNEEIGEGDIEAVIAELISGLDGGAA